MELNRTMKTGTLDTDIADCLQVNGRASWTLIADVIGQPERTVARRGQHLLDSGLVRVSAYLDEAHLNAVDALLMRVYVQQGATVDVARKLAQRRDAYSVTAFPGSNRVEGLFLPVGVDPVDEIANRLLASMESVTGSELARITRAYRRGHQWHGGRLDAAARERLLKDVVADDESSCDALELTDQDRIITEIMERDGRAAVKEVAEAAGVTSQFIGRRMRALFRSGLLQMRTEVSSEISGLALEAHLRLQVDAARVDQLGLHLADDPSIMYCVATTGSHPIECIVKLPTLSDLHRWTMRTLGVFPGVVVTECETEPRRVRRANILFP